MSELRCECFECEKWKYDERIARKYGQGCGICDFDGEPKGCNHKACIAFCEGNNEKIFDCLDN